MQTNMGSGASNHSALDVLLLEESENMDRAISRLAASMLREAAIDLARGTPDVKKDAEEWINGTDTALPFDMCVAKIFPEDAFAENIVDVVKEKIQAEPTVMIDAMSQFLSDVSDRTIFSPKVNVFKKLGTDVDDQDLTVDQENEMSSPRP